MNFKTTIMLIVLLGIALAAWYFTRDTPGREQIERERSASVTPGGQPLFAAADFPTESVERITIQRGDTGIVIVKDGEAWRQVEPVEFAISTWQGKQLVDKAATLRYTDRFTPGEGDNPALADVGLDTPTAVVTLQWPAKDEQDARSQTIKFGRVIGGTAYVQVNEDADVYAVPADVHRLLAAGKPEDWRSRSITAPTEGKADRIVLEREGTTITLAKVDGRWMLDESRGDRADADAVKGLLSGVGSLYISEFVADAPASLAMYGLAEPRMTLRVAASEHPITIHIGSATDLKNESFFAMMSRDDGTPPKPVVFTVSKTGIEKFEKTADDLRDKRLTTASSSDVSEVIVTREGQPPLHAVKKPEGWAFGEPGPGYGIDGDAVRELLDSVLDARATSFVAEVPSDAAAQATVTLNLIGGKAPERLSVWPHESGEAKAWLVLRDGEKTGHVVPRDRLDRLFKPVVSLRDRQIIGWSADEVAGLTVARDGQTISLSRKREEGAWGAWTMAGDEQLEASAAAGLLAAVAPMRAEMWVGPEDHAGTLTLTVTPAEGEAMTLHVDPQTRLAKVAGVEAGLAVLPRAVIDAANAEFRYRTVLPIKVEEIGQVTLKRGDTTIVIDRGADGRYARADGEALDDAAAGRLFDELAGLRVERYRDAGKVKADLAKPVTTLVLQLTGGTARTLALWPPSGNDFNEHVGRLDDSPWLLVLSADAVEKLLAVFGDAPEPGAVMDPLDMQK